MSARTTALASLGVLRIAGPDASAFLQGQLSNDLRRLTPATSLVAAYNTPQGRVIAILSLLERDAALLAILPRELIATVIERLRRYVLRSKVTLTDESGSFFMLGALDAAELERMAPGPAPATHVRDGALSIVRLPGAAARHLILAPEHERASVLERLRAEPADDEPWRCASIAAGEPQVYAETSELFVAQMLNLDLIEALSFTKGCYTGQEIITRTQHLGRIKRRMLRFRLPASAGLRRGDTVSVGPGRQGRIVEHARNAAGDLEVLAVVPITSEESATPGPLNSFAVPLPLPYPVPGVDGD